MGRFEDRVAIVTGAGSGLGAAIATRLAGEGASVCVDLTDAAAGTAEGLGDRGGPSRSTWPTATTWPGWSGTCASAT
jgi:NAD(P)-dependent dehydrogenase (short-subunit alcohol dehydrogenase family)